MSGPLSDACVSLSLPLGGSSKYRMAGTTLVGIRYRHRSRRICETSIGHLEQMRRNVVHPILNTVDLQPRITGTGLGGLGHVAIRAQGNWRLVGRQRNILSDEMRLQISSLGVVAAIAAGSNVVGRVIDQLPLELRALMRVMAGSTGHYLHIILVHAGTNQIRILLMMRLGMQIRVGMKITWIGIQLSRCIERQEIIPGSTCCHHPSVSIDWIVRAK